LLYNISYFVLQVILIQFFSLWDMLSSIYYTTGRLLGYFARSTYMYMCPNRYSF
jgi:hypothetical protein